MVDTLLLSSTLICGQIQRQIQHQMQRQKSKKAFLSHPLRILISSVRKYLAKKRFLSPIHDCLFFLERVILVSEWYEDCLEQYLKSDKFGSITSLACLARQLLSALVYLEGEGITHRALEPRNILVTPEVISCAIVYHT